jgi:hypothetical protein
VVRGTLSASPLNLSSGIFTAGITTSGCALDFASDTRSAGASFFFSDAA